jgi:D-alanyl-lipoteichoic acid acyltransferase DltB (MBOAT superfamily)
MSLSNWVLENLFKPISFQFRGALGKLTGIFALLISFGVISMWHGLTWNYVIFGIFHALGLLIENVLKLEWVKNKSRLVRNIQRSFFIMSLSIITLFFNNYSLNDTFRILGYFNGFVNPRMLIENFPLIAFSITLVLGLFFVELKYKRKASPYFSAVLLILIFLLWPEEAKTFIYEF